MLQVLQIAGFRVGVCHGHQVVPWGDKEALAILQRQLGVDILITGHTHEFKVRRREGGDRARRRGRGPGAGSKHLMVHRTGTGDRQPSLD